MARWSLSRAVGYHERRRCGVGKFVRRGRGERGRGERKNFLYRVVGKFVSCSVSFCIVQILFVCGGDFGRSLGGCGMSWEAGGKREEKTCLVEGNEAGFFVVYGMR